MKELPRNPLFGFIALHSFLMGLFPFFLPVYLWYTGFTLSMISLVVAFTGLGFLVSLWGWEHASQKRRFSTVLLASFWLEIGVLSLIFILDISGIFLVLGFLQGLYNGFFWTTQRVLFVDSLKDGVSGKKFGNIQILSFLVLKLGLFMGAFFMDQGGFLFIYLGSLLLVLAVTIYHLCHPVQYDWPASLKTHKVTTLKSLWHFRDRPYTRLVFCIDGPLLFTEGAIWTLTLFTISQESFLTLGYWVIGIALLFSLAFWFIKESIDKVSVQKVFVVSVIIYSMGFLGRFFMEASQTLPQTFWGLLAIGFATSFFRLTFNKRFFDRALEVATHPYLFSKSYYSQFSIFIFFSLLSLYLSFRPNTIETLPPLYILSGIMALGYLGYKKR